MNIIYQLTNMDKFEKNIKPYHYIGSKMNYNGRYLGSSKHPLMILEKRQGAKFKLEILEIVSDPKSLTEREREWQEKFDVVANKDFYNLSYATAKFSCAGMKWFCNPLDGSNILCYEGSEPDGWILGKKPFKNDPKTYKSPSRLKKHGPMRRGEHHKDSKKWTVQTPDNQVIEVIALEPFCQERGIMAPALKYTLTTGKPISRGASKGYMILSVDNK